jgi:hypothetical protein
MGAQKPHRRHGCIKTDRAIPPVPGFLAEETCAGWARCQDPRGLWIDEQGHIAVRLDRTSQRHRHVWGWIKWRHGRTGLQEFDWLAVG